MKRIISVILVLFTVLSFCSCDKDASSGGGLGNGYKGIVNGDETTIEIDGDQATVTFVKKYSQKLTAEYDKMHHDIKTVVTGKVVGETDGVVEIDFTEGTATVKWTITGDGDAIRLFTDTIKNQCATYPDDQKQLMTDMADGKEITFTFAQDRVWRMLGVRENLKFKPEGKSFEWII